MHSLAVYQQQQQHQTPQHNPHHHHHYNQRIQVVQALKACETDIYFNNYGMEQQRSAYGGCNTPELTRSTYNTRVPQMGLSATGHRRTLSSNFSGYSHSYLGGTPPPPPIIEPSPVVSKNPFLSMIQHQQPTVVVPSSAAMANRTYENVPFSPNRHLYADMYDKETTGTLRSSLKKKRQQQQQRNGPKGDHDRVGETSKEHSFSSSGSRVRFSPHSCSPSADGKSFSSPSFS